MSHCECASCECVCADLLTHEVLQGRLGHATALSRAIPSAARPRMIKANSCQLALLPSSFSSSGEKAITCRSEQ